MVSTVALYIRVSTDEQVDGYSIDGQMDMLKVFCRRHNLTLYKAYIDAGKSAKSIQGRPFAAVTCGCTAGVFSKRLSLEAKSAFTQP